MKLFFSLLQEAQKEDLLNLFFNFFLTHEEKSDIEKRVLLIRALLEGKYTQREIADKYHVSIAKITRGSNMLKNASPRLINFLKKQLVDHV